MNKKLDLVNALLVDAHTDEGWLSDIPHFAKEVHDTQLLVKEGGFIDIGQIAEIATCVVEARIIKLLEADICKDWTYTCCDGWCSAHIAAIALIKEKAE